MASSQPQSMVVLKFIGCDEAAASLRERLDAGDTDAVKMIPEGEPGEEDRPQTFVSKDFRFEIDGRAYPARLVNLPTIVETHKTWDRATYYKCGDVGQAMLVFPDEAARAADAARSAAFAGTAWAPYHPDGITPPTHEVVRRRFSRARKRARVEFTREEVAAVEREMIELLEAEGAPPDEPPEEDVVRFEPWMVDAQGEGRTVTEDNPLVLKHPWILLPGEDLAPAQGPGRLEPDEGSSARPRGRAAVAAELKSLTSQMKALEAQRQSPDADSSAQRRVPVTLARLGETKKKLLLELSKIDRTLLEQSLATETLGAGPG